LPLFRRVSNSADAAVAVTEGLLVAVTEGSLVAVTEGLLVAVEEFLNDAVIPSTPARTTGTSRIGKIIRGIFFTVGM
jgi:hypothetical protein